MRSQNLTYIPALDHLRALASLLIVLYHTQLLVSYPLRFGRPFELDPWIQAEGWLHAVIVEGHTAVSLFFVLSGFLFTRAAYRREIAYGAFLRNRLLRIYPLFLLLVAFGVAVLPQQFSLSAFLQTVFGLANHPGALQLGPISAMFWTLAIECQFYLLFLLALANRSGARPLLLLGLATLLLRGLGVALGGDVHQLSYWTLVGRIDQFLVGMVIAVWMADRDLGKERFGVWIFGLSCLLLAAGLYGFNLQGGWPEKQAWRFLWPTAEALAWGLFLASYFAVETRLPAALSRAFARLGEISYSTYLLHFMLIHLFVSREWYFTTSLGPHDTALLNGLLLVLPAVWAISALSYLAVERPFLALRGRYLR